MSTQKISSNLLVPISLLVALSLASCDLYECENNIKFEVASPNQTNRFVVFSRECGATVDFNTQGSILGSKQKLKNIKGNVFIIDEGLVNIEWKDDRTIWISIRSNAEFYEKNTSLDKINIIYKLVEN